MKRFGLLLMTSLFSAFFAVLAYTWIVKPKESVIIQENPTSVYTSLTTDAPDNREYIVATPTEFTTAAAKVTPAVVYIETKTESDDWWGGYGASSGSGVIISNDGFIVTNNHVIDGANKINVTLDDDRIYEAELIGRDPSTDLALIKVKEQNLPFLKFADSEKTKVGEWVLAVGNPFSLTSTVTAGIVSAKGRNINILDDRYAIESFIQTDAAVNPGNSGGALVNTNGDLIGVNTAIITKSGRYEGYSFAVPSNLVKKVIADLKEFGVVNRGFLGVQINELNQQLVERLDLKSSNGVYIDRVNVGSGADDAGIKAKDVIIGINGKKVKSVAELQEQVAQYRAGDEIVVEYIRKGEISAATIQLRDQNNSITMNKGSEEGILKKLGFELKNLSPSERGDRLEGVLVLSITKKSKIAQTQMDPGYVITKVGDKRVKSIDEVIALIERAEVGEKIMLEGYYKDYLGEYFYVFKK